MAIIDLSVIIVSFNSAGWLRPCLESVFAHAGTCCLDVVVVDNASNDGSAELVDVSFPRSASCATRTAASPTPTTVALRSPMPRTRCSSIRTPRFGPEPSVTSWTRCVRDRPWDSSAAASSTSDGTLYPTIRRFPTPVRQLCEALGSERLPLRPSWTGHRELDPAAYDRETRCDWVSGSFMFARREAVVQAGLMDERYFLYCEETDLCAAIMAAGWEIRYLPEMTFVHHCSKNGQNPRLVAQGGVLEPPVLPQARRPGATKVLGGGVGFVLRPAIIRVRRP